MYFGLIGFGLLVGLILIAVMLVVLILFLLNLMRLLEAVHPQNRGMSPGLVWLNIIPVFGVGWMIYTVIKIKDSVGRENAARWGASIDQGNTHTVGLVYSILGAAAFVFSYGGYASRGLSTFAGIISLASFVTWIVYWVKTHGLRKQLESTAGRGYGPGPYGPGGQFGPGGAYPPGGPTPYAPGGPAPYAPGPAPYTPGEPAPYSGEPAPYPPGETDADSGTGEDQTGDETGSARSCALCGKGLDPDDQFCTACGKPVAKE